MAIVKNNIITTGLSGSLGKLVTKQYQDKTVVTQSPESSRFPRSNKQKKNNALFAKAVEYARKKLQTQSGAAPKQKRQFSLRNQLIREYMLAHKGQKVRKPRVKYYSRQQLEALGCNPRQLDTMDYLRREKQIDNTAFQRLNSVSKATATRDLKKLVSLGLIRPYGTRGAGIGYCLCPPL